MTAPAVNKRHSLVWLGYGMKHAWKMKDGGASVEDHALCGVLADERDHVMSVHDPRCPYCSGRLEKWTS